MTFGGSQPSWGKMYRYFPLKATFVVAVILFEIGSLVCAVAPSANALIVGRTIAGFGGAAWRPASLPLSPSRRLSRGGRC